MTGTSNERELELVSRYLEEHFNPIRGLVNRKVVDPEARELALRRCTKHIFHWKREVLGDEVGPDHPDYGEPVKPREDTDVPGADEGDEIPADQRPPEEWVTGEEPATPRQLAVLKDRGVRVPEGCTKARASQLISQHVYGSVEA